jgi:hypothetical protein
MQDGLTRDVYALVSHTGAASLGSWQIWTLLVVGAIGVLMAQNAFDCAPLTSSLPAISIVEPLTGIVLGVALFDAHVRHGALALAIAAIVDLPSLNDTGVIGRTYDLAKARPAIGFWLELVGALLVLVTALLVLRRGGFAEVPRRRPQRRAPRGDAVSRP